MLNFIKNNFQKILGLVVIVLFTGYFIINIKSFKLLLDIKPLYLVLVALCYGAIVLTNGLFIKYVIEPFNKNIKTREAAHVSLLSSIGNFFASSGAGLGFRAIYLKKKHDLSYQEYMITVYGNYLLIFICNAIFGISSLLLVRNKGGSAYTGLFLFFGALLVTSIALCFIRITGEPKKARGFVGKGIDIIREMTIGWNRIARNKRLLMHLTLVIMIQIILSFCIAWLEIKSLSISIGLPEILLLSILGSLSIFVSLTPANIGVKELIYIITATTIGLTTPEILSISIVDRGVLFMTLGILWLFIGRNKETKTT